MLNSSLRWEFKTEIHIHILFLLWIYTVIRILKKSIKKKTCTTNKSFLFLNGEGIGGDLEAGVQVWGGWWGWRTGTGGRGGSCSSDVKIIDEFLKRWQTRKNRKRKRGKKRMLYYLFVCGSGSWGQDIIYIRQAFYQLSYTQRPVLDIWTLTLTLHSAYSEWHFKSLQVCMWYVFILFVE